MLKVMEKYKSSVACLIKKVYVINGNHDVNNPHAVKYLGDTTERVDNVSPAEFKDIYREFGSGEAIAADPNSLSYVAEPVPGLRLIAMDSCVYQPEAKCEGAFSPATLSWIKQQVAVARQEGKLAVGFLHHGLIDHFSVQRQLFPEYIVQDADQVAAELAAGGLQVVFTGHFHAQDIVQKQFGKNTLCDIETGSLVTYPIPYRIVEIRPDYRLNIATHKIQSINYDLGGQDFPTYARNYLVQGLNGLVPQVVAGILIKQGVPPEQALPQANEKLSTPVAANLTVKDLLVNAMVSHYQGDETIAPQLMPVIQAMAGSTDSLTKMIGQTLLSLGTDPFPTDNTGEIDLTPWYLTIMHINDTHAHLDDDKALVARRATAVKQIRGEAPDSLLLDAGDVFSGTLYFTQYQGQADLELMNMLGYDAIALGNHEFDKGPLGLAKFITGSYAEGYREAASFPLLNANFDFSAEPALKNLAKTTVGEEVCGASLGRAIYPAIIFDVNGEKVGLFGLTTEDTAEISSPGPDIKINDALAAAESAVKTLSDKGINKIIALSHLGWNEDLQLAQQVEGIDMVVGGHSHTKPAEYPTVVTDSQHQTPTLVVQAGEYGKYLGRLEVGFSDTGLVTSYGGGLLDVTAKDAGGNYTYAVDQAVYDRLMVYKAPLEDLKNTIVGSTQVALNGERDNVRTKETNLGNLIADAMLEKGAPAGAVMTITNGGGIRASIDQGEITLGEALTVMPFGNTLVVLELSGQQIIDALENGVSQVEQKAGRFPQVAGLKFTWDPQKPAGSRIVKVEAKTAGGYQSIDRSAKYLVATNNFLAGGGDGYIVFKAASRVYDMGFVDYEVFKEYLQKHSPVSPQVEGRITEGKAPVPSGGGGSASPAPAGQLITASGGTITGQGATIVIPAGTVDQDIRVKVEKVTDLSNSPIPDKAVLVSAVLNITKDKAGDFKKPVTITMAFEKTKVDLEKQDLGIYWFNDSSKQWNRLENNKVDFAAGKVSGDTLHFTRFTVLAIGKETQKPVETPATVVKDIAGHWAEDIIRQMVAGGIVKGYPDGTFKPESSVTRAEFTTMLVNTLGVTESGRLPFNDVPDNSWYYPSVAKAYAAGLVKGVSANGFAPQVQITRQEMAAMMVRALGRLDQPVEVGTGEAAQILHAFSDRQEIAPWVANTLAAAVKAGLVAGRGDGQVAPAASATRAEAVVMIKRMLQKAGKL